MAGIGKPERKIRIEPEPRRDRPETPKQPAPRRREKEPAAPSR